MASVLYDAVVVPCGPDSVAALGQDGYTVHFVTEAFKHGKAIGAFGAGVKLLRKANLGETRIATSEDDIVTDVGVVTAPAAEDSLSAQYFETLISEIAKHRAWQRDTSAVPA
jgi:catalase